MKILVDTSVWSLALRRKAGAVNPEALILKDIITHGEDVYLLGIILQEMLQGVKSPKDFQTLKTYFEAFPLVDLTREDYVQAAELKNSIMKKGVQASTIDALIASCAISREYFLFTADVDFDHIAEHSKLKLLKKYL